MDVREMNNPVSGNAKRIIAEKGLKQKYVAQRTGVSEDVLSRMINGKALIKPYMIPKLASALEVTPAELFQ